MTKLTIDAIKAQIDADLPDNTTGLISPADVRSAMKNMIDSILGVSGWSSYIDTDYPNSGTAFTLSANTDTILPNNAGTKIESQKPLDIPTYYSPESLSYDGGTADFAIGETVTGGTSGATAEILDISGDTASGVLFLDTVTGTFSDNEAITSASGAAVANGTQGGGRIIGRNSDSLDCMLYFKAIPASTNQWIDIWVDIGGSVGELYRQTFEFPKGSGVQRGVLYALPSGYTLDTWEANGGSVYIRSNGSVDIHSINFNFDRTYKSI